MPHSKPKRVKNIRDLFGTVLAEDVVVVRNGRKARIPASRLIAIGLVDKALKGDVKAMKMIFDTLPSSEFANKISFIVPEEFMGSL